MTNASTVRTGTPIYYWRHKCAYVAWFCIAEDAKAFLYWGAEYGDLAPETNGAVPGVNYKDLGHECCMAENCPEG